MDELIVRSLQGRTTPEQEREFQRWRDASADHEAQYQAIAEVWERTYAAEPERQRGPAPTLTALERRARAARVPAAATAPGPSRRALAWAAVIVLSLGIGFWSGRGFVPAALDGSYQVVEVITTSGEMATAVLPDGSVLRLAPRTRIQAAISGTERTVNVDGRAFLSVVRDEARPMRVRTVGGEATVRGTRFEVDARDPLELRLLVVEGLVTLHGQARDADVRAGQAGTARRDGPPRVEEVADLEARLGWLGNFVAFESTPLLQVARELEWRTGIPVRIADPALNQRTVTGSYTEDDLAYVLESVCRAAAVSCRMERDTLFVHPIEERQR